LSIIVAIAMLSLVESVAGIYLKYNIKLVIYNINKGIQMLV